MARRRTVKPPPSSRRSGDSTATGSRSHKDYEDYEDVFSSLVSNAAQLEDNPSLSPVRKGRPVVKLAPMFNGLNDSSSRQYHQSSQQRNTRGATISKTTCSKNHQPLDQQDGQDSSSSLSAMNSSMKLETLMEDFVEDSENSLDCSIHTLGEKAYRKKTLKDKCEGFRIQF